MYDDENFKETKRAHRRINRARKKVKVAQMLCKWGLRQQPPGKYVDNMKFCSCLMCGNPRKHFKKKTLQELKADAPVTPAATNGE